MSQFFIAGVVLDSSVAGIDGKCFRGKSKTKAGVYRYLTRFLETHTPNADQVAVWVYTEATKAETLRMVTRAAVDPQSPIGWSEAALILSLIGRGFTPIEAPKPIEGGGG